MAYQNVTPEPIGVVFKAYWNGVSLFICTCRVVEYRANENVTLAKYLVFSGFNFVVFFSFMQYCVFICQCLYKALF